MRVNLPRRTLLFISAGTALLPLLARAQTPLKVGVIGSGHIGGTVGSLWVKAGHPVLFSSRHPEALAGMVQDLGPLAHAGTPAEAVAFGDVVFVAVPYGALPQIGRDLGPALAGKVVLDACNAVASRDGETATVAKDKGIGLASAAYLPGTKLVRGFNTLGYRILQSEAHRGGEPLAIPIAGDDPAAVQSVAGLVRDAGFVPVVVGPLAKASEFAMGAPGYGQNVGAQDLKAKLGLAQ